MDLYLSQNDHELIAGAARELFLALVFASGEVRIKVSDSTRYPGHAQWVAADQIEIVNVVAGFSLIVKAGKVTGLFPSSEMNRTPDWKLESGQLEALYRLLPLSSDFKLY